MEETGRILSIREEQVLRHLNKGLRYAEIAAVLCISPATVKAHCHKIYKRLGARNKEEAVYKYFDKK